MATASTSQRTKNAKLIRPGGPKLIQAVPWNSGTTVTIAQAIDLSLPIRGIRLDFRGRLVTGTAPMTSAVPEGLLNLISNIVIQGTNARQKGNITLWNIDLATAWVASYLFGARGCGTFTIALAGAGTDAEVPLPATPFPAAGTAVPNHAAGYFAVANATYDFIITCDFPFHPWEANSLGKQPGSILGFLVRNEEWKDSLQIQLTFPAIATATATTTVLGVQPAGTTNVFSAYNSGAGTPVVTLYSLPMLMGLDSKDSVLPGILSRTTQPINVILQSAGTNIVLANLQKQPTPRVILKNGTGTVAPSFATLDTGSGINLTALGITLGGNRNVRNLVSPIVHKHQQADVYDAAPIQGYTCMDFMDQGNPDSSFEGQNIGDGATFQLVGNCVGLANAFGLVLQEQIIHTPTGPLLANG